MGADLLNLNIIGARLLDPECGIDRKGDLYIRDGKIYFEKPEDRSIAVEDLNIPSHVIMPGLLDLRAHPRDPSHGNCESIYSVTRSAARGGFVGILAMPDTTPHADNPGTIRFIQDRIKQSACVRVWLAGCLTKESKGEVMAPLGSLKEAGIAAVTDCPFSPVDSQIFLNSVHYAKMFDLPVIEFPREMYLTKNGHAHESALSLKMGLGGFPRIAEEIAVQRAISIAKNLDAPIHLSSISSSEAIELIREAKKKEVRITADSTAHHLLLNEKAIVNYDSNAKTLPPLREEVDRQALVQAVCDGTIDAITSGHQPYPEHEKKVEFDRAPAGVIGLETAFASAFDSLVKHTDDPFPIIAKAMSMSPHKVLMLKPPGLKDGNLANLTIIQNNSKWTYFATQGLSGAVNSPIDGRSFSSKIAMTIVDGKQVYNSMACEE